MTTTANLSVRVRLFAGVRSQLKRDFIVVTVPPDSSVSAVHRELERTLPQFQSLLAASRLASGSRFCDPDDLLREDCELAWIPPVSGG